MPLGDPLALELPTPAGAQTYTVPAVTAAQFWRLRADNEPFPTVVADRSAIIDTVSLALTDRVLDRMLADDVLDAHVRLAASAALSWHATGDPDAAAAVWTGTEQNTAPVTADELDQYGWGEKNANGDWTGYDLPEDVAARMTRKPDQVLTLTQVWAHSGLIAADLMSEYRVDVAGRVMRRRSGPWLRRLVDGLLAADTRLARTLYQETKEADR